MGAAIVGGFISAVGVVVGVYLSQFISRRLQRDETLRALVARISSAHTSLAPALWDKSKFDSTATQTYLRMNSDLIEAQSVLAGLSKRKIEAVEPHLTQLSVKLFAALARSQAGTLQEDERLGLLEPIRELNRLVRPAARAELDFLGETAHFIKEGLVATPRLPTLDKPLTCRNKLAAWSPFSWLE